jgi:hypothetical protein
MTLLLIKQSRLAPFKNPTNLVEPGFRILDRSKTGPKKCPENDHSKPDSPVFGSLLYMTLKLKKLLFTR